VVPFRNAGGALAECVASLKLQEDADFRTLFIDDGSIDNSAAAVPTGDPRIRLVRNKQPRGLARAVLAGLRQGLAGDAIVAALDARSKLRDGGALRRLAEIYESSGCRAMYSQFREPGGDYGRAMPFPDAESFAARVVEEYRPGLTTWRAEAMASLGAGMLRQDDGLDQLFDRIIGHVGFIRTFFADDVLYVRDSA
jgi:glycosyltransferase involved in cell wall biosynthesis